MDDETFLKQFEDHSLPFAQWTHRSHIRMAYLFLLRHTLEVARAMVPPAIRAYNNAHNVPEGPDRGYHETVTQAWLQIVHATLCEYGACPTAETFLDEHPELLQKKNLRLFYSRDLITSPRAKAGFVEPDLAPLPRSKKSAPCINDIALASSERDIPNSSETRVTQ